MKLSVFKVLTGKSKSSKSYSNISGTKTYDITKKQYKEIKKKACPWKFTVVESPSSTSYLAREVLVYSYIQNNGIQQLKFQNKNGQKISTQTQLPFYFSKPFTISNEFYYYEIKVIKNNNNSKIYFGLGISSYIFTELPGTTINTICYHSSGLIYAAGSVVAYAKVVNEGDVVGIGYYPSNGNIFFTLNGDFVQTISGSVLNRQRFYPHLGSDGECILEVNFGLNHFLYTPEESNKYLTTEELNNRNIKKNENEKLEEDANTTFFNDSFSTIPRLNVPTTGSSSRVNTSSSVDATNNASYIENVNKKTTDNVDFFESIENTNSNYTSNISNTQKNSSSTIFSPFTDSSSSNFNSMPSSSSTLFNSSSSNNNNFGLNSQSSLFTIKEDDSKDNALVPFSSTDTNKSNALVPFSSNNTNKSNALVPFSNNNSNTMSMINTTNSSNPFLIYNNNNTSFNNTNTNTINNYNGFMNNNNNYNTYTTPLSYNPNNPFNDMMKNTNINNSNLMANTSFNSSYNNNNINNFNTFSTINNGNNNTMGTSSSFRNTNSFNSSNPFNNYNLNSSSNTFGNNGFTNTTNNNTMFSSSSSINNSSLPNNTLSKSWTPSSSLTTSLATSQGSFNALTTTSLTTPMLTITRSMTYADKTKNTSFASLGINNNDTKHLSINNIISSSSSLNINNTVASTGNNLSEKSFEIDTKQTSPILSNMSGSNLSSPINSPFGSSFNSLSFSGSPKPLNTNTVNNDLTSSNANILSGLNKDSSFSFSNSSITRSKTFAGTGSNGSYGASQSNVFNMNNLMINTTFKDDLNSKNQSPISTPTTPIYQNTGTSLGKSPYSNPFSTPLNNNSPSSYGNPFGTPTNEIRPLSLGASPIQSSNLSFHMPIIPNNTVATHNTGTSYHTSWDNSFNNSFNNSFVLNTNTTSAPMVTTNLTGVKSIHSSSNPFEGIQ